MGSLILVSCSWPEFLKAHTTDKSKHLLKLVSFLHKNKDMPFVCKERVLNSCVLSALLYGCESWFSSCTKPLDSLYMSAIKAILGVRQTTTNLLCLVEIGYPSLIAYIKQRQLSFFKGVTSIRSGMVDVPLVFVLSLAELHNTKAWQYIGPC